MHAVAPGLGTPSPVAGSILVPANAQAGLAPVPTAGVGDTSTRLPAARVGGAVPSGCCAAWAAPQAVALFLLFPHGIIWVFSVFKFLWPKSQGTSPSRGVPVGQHV